LTDKFNSYLLKYAYGVLLRSFSKNLFIFLVMTLLVALLCATLFLSSAIKDEYTTRVFHQADIIITNQKAMHYKTFNIDALEKVLNVEGVESAKGRLYGSYYFNQAEKKLNIIAVDEFGTYSDEVLKEANSDLDSKTMLVLAQTKKLLEKYYYKEYFNFVKEDGSLDKVGIKKVLESKDRQKRENLIVMRNELFRDIFTLDENEINDIAVSVANKDEVAFIAHKLEELFPSAKVTLKKDTLVEYEKSYNLKSGFFLTIFVVSFFTFFIIIYDKLSGVSSHERREIGVLKALGWRVGDVLEAKFYEAFILSFSAYVLGVVVALLYVYLFDGYLLLNIFLSQGSILESVSLVFEPNIATLVLVFLLTLPPYIFATIIPSWRVATRDADEVMR
jgi:ABC-type lipoprotein release transport system permease subunit